MITLDTSGIYALLDRRERHHHIARAALEQAGRPFLVPVAILAEVAYIVEQRAPLALEPFLTDLENGAYTLDCGEQDIARVRELIKRYADLPLGFADATVVACAERSGGRVLAFDRDFDVVAREGRIRTTTS